MQNEGFLDKDWAKDHAETVDRLPLEPRFGLTYLRDALKDCRSILDVGCGGGQLQAFVREVNPDVRYHGVDFSSASLREARARLPESPLVQGDGARLPFADNSIDLVYQHDVLMHHPQPMQMLAEMYRVARRGIVFNARLSPRIDEVLALEDRAHGIAYQTLPLHAVIGQLIASPAPPSEVRFKVVELIGLNPTRFHWTTKPHYTQVLGRGRQFHTHAVAMKGQPGQRSVVRNDTPFVLWAATLAWAGPARAWRYLTGQWRTKT